MAEEHEAAKKELAASREAQEKSREEFAERMKGRPTPTQAELDQIMLGIPVEISPDGSGPDPNITPKAVEGARPAATYQTRHATAARPAAHRTE